MLGGKLYGSDIEQSSFYTAAYMKINALHNFSDFDGLSNILPCTHMYRVQIMKQYYTTNVILMQLSPHNCETSTTKILNM